MVPRTTSLTDPAGFHDLRNRAGVSLPEVLVVAAIIAFMLALLVPGLDAAREQARRVMCKSNERSWGVALGAYRNDFNDYIPTEGTYLRGGILESATWYNALPPYLGLPPYRDLEGANEAIHELPNIHVWICPAKNLTPVYKSDSGMNQFHYGMNQVLDGLDQPNRPSRDTPGFLDMGKSPIRAHRFYQRPHTVFMFDIAPNSPAGTPRNVANMHQRWKNRPLGKFHGDYANLLYLDGGVTNCMADDLVTDRDFRYGKILWHHPNLYWGYLPEPEPQP